MGPVWFAGARNQGRHAAHAVRHDIQPVDASIRPTGVLVVDDEYPIRRSLDRGLRRRGFVVWTASDGNEAVDLYCRFAAQIDVVLCDLHMPGLDGRQTLVAVRRVNPLTRFCFMTADGRPSTSEGLLALGAARVFAKPFSSVDEVAQGLRELALAASPERAT